MNSARVTLAAVDPTALALGARLPRADEVAKPLPRCLAPGVYESEGKAYTYIPENEEANLALSKTSQPIPQLSYAEAKALASRFGAAHVFEDACRYAQIHGEACLRFDISSKFDSCQLVPCLE